MTLRQRRKSDPPRAINPFRRAVLVSSIAAGTMLAPGIAEAELQAKGRITAKKEYRSNRSALDLITAPYLMKGGKVTSIVLVVQTLEIKGGRSAYLVAAVPESTITELNRQMSGMSKERKEEHLHEWVAKQKKIIIDQYFATGNRPDSLDFNLSGNIIQPPPKPKPSATPAPSYVAPKPPPKRPAARPKAPAKTEPLKLPPQITKGNGSKRDPYDVTPARGRSSAGIAATNINFPMTLHIEDFGPVYFTLHLTASQLSKSKIYDTGTELMQILRPAIVIRAKESGKTAHPEAVNNALSQIRKKLIYVRGEASKDAQLNTYFQTN